MEKNGEIVVSKKQLIKNIEEIKKIADIKLALLLEQDQLVLFQK